MLKRLFEQPQHLLFATILGTLGFVVNCYPIPFFANVQLVIGNAFYVIAAILLGPWYALFTAMMAVSGLMLSWDSAHVYLFFGLEALFLGYCRQRNIYALYGSAIYWIAIGLPLFLVYAKLIFNTPLEHLAFATIKQGVNGLIYTSLASLIVLLIPWLWNFQGKVKDKARRGFSAQLTYSITLMITISLLMSAIIFNYFYMQRQQALMKINLNTTLSHISKAADSYIDNHKIAINSTAEQFSNSAKPLADWQPRLSSINAKYPGFITMLIADANADVVAATPITTFKNIDNKLKQISIKDRDYFIEAFYNLKTYVSSVFLGRGLGNDSIIAISAPILDAQGNPKGIIEGSLDLTHLHKIDDYSGQTEHQSLILVDEQNQIIYASQQLDLTPMTPFKSSPGGPFYHTELELINIFDINSPSPEFFYAKKKMDNGWTLYVVEAFSPLLKLAEQQMINSFIMLLISLFFSFFISRKISNLLTVPLELVAKEFSKEQSGKLKTKLIDDNSPKEVYQLYQRLIKSKSQLIAHQVELEDMVDKRTVELQKANDKLKDLVDKDALTNLYNRRYAETRFTSVLDFCLRSEQAITVAILDLDFFKSVNDSFGHLAGDECLRQVAQLLKIHFKRDTDIIARYGGEEFILILPISNPLNIERHLNKFREALAKLVILSPDSKKPFKVTTSIGAITANANLSKDLDHWIKVADDNLYQAKQKGRNRLIINIVDDEQ